MTARKRSHAWRTLAKRRIAIARNNNEPCCRCHGRLGPIRYDQPGTKRLGPTADHLTPLAHGGPELPPINELGVAHRTCNSSHGGHISSSRQGLGPGSRGGNPKTYTPRKKTPNTPQLFPKPPDTPTPGEGKTLPQIPPGAIRTPPGVLQDSDPEHGPEPAMFTDVPWLAPLFPLPEEAVWPRLMSAPHPRAVGSFGPDAIDWIEARRASDPRVPARAKRLRWFQRLALLRQWEHDDEGQLCWPEYLLAVSRQVGKSVLLSERSMCRVELFPGLAGEPQLVMQVSKDLSAAREVQRLVRLWATDREEAAKLAARGASGKLPAGYRPTYVVRGTHGQEEIELPDGSRYMIRGRDSVYSYSVSAAELDEAWGVRPDVVFDGIEPTMAERELGQLCLTSTAHPRATLLFPGRRGLAVRDLWSPTSDSPLLLEWSAHRLWDPHVEGSWRAASPHWDARRLRVVGRAHARWVEGSEDERTRSAGGFPYQFLNMWPGTAGVPMWLEEKAWLVGARPGLVVPADRAVVGVSLDSGSGRWPVVVAGRVDGGVGVGLVGEYPSMDEALAAAAGRRGSGCVLLTPRGLRGHVMLRGARETVHAHEGDVTAAQDLCRAWIAGGRLLHEASDVGVTAAVLTRPLRREVGRFDAGTLVLLCAWWAGRERPRSAAA